MSYPPVCARCSPCRRRRCSLARRGIRRRRSARIRRRINWSPPCSTSSTSFASSMDGRSSASIAKLTAAADHHSLEMVHSGYFGHESANGGHFAQRIKNFYRPRSGTAAVEGGREPHLASAASDGPRRRGLLARQPRSPREPAQASLSRSRHLGRACAGRPWRLREPARCRAHGRLRRALANPRRGRRYPSLRAPVAQWKSSGLLSRRSGVRILPGAPVTDCGRRRRAGGSRASPRKPLMPALREQRAWLPIG